jgi:hypothetical protein
MNEWPVSTAKLSVADGGYLGDNAPGSDVLSHGNLRHDPPAYDGHEVHCGNSSTWVSAVRP